MPMMNVHIRLRWWVRPLLIILRETAFVWGWFVTLDDIDTFGEFVHRYGLSLVKAQ